MQVDPRSIPSPTHSFLKIWSLNTSTTILPASLIQEEQLSVNGGKSTKYW